MAVDEDRATAMYRHRPETLSIDRGSGPALVCSHSALMDWTMFRPQIDAFAGEYRVVAYNSRARTDQWQGPYDLHDLGRDCRALLESKDIDSCVLLGMSMGGFMTLRFALEYPDVVDGIVLVDTMAEAYDESERDQYGQMVETAKRMGDIPEPTVDITSNIMFGRTTLDERPDLVDRWKRRWQTYPGAAVHDEVHSFIHADGVEHRLDEIDVPALIVHGEEDVSIPPERAEPMADGIADARLELIPDAGHCSNLEHPEPVNDALAAFLASVYG